MRKKVLILGIGGQDGAYLSHFLLEKGYEVHGTSRDIDAASFDGLNAISIKNKINFHSVNLNDYSSILSVLKNVEPTEIYNLSAQSSVGLSFAQPIETLNSITNATLNLLEAIRYMDSDIRLYNASSSEMFGDSGRQILDEETYFRPHSPYGIAKAAAHWLIESYRKGYGLFACSGILFNHESPLRNERFVTQKIVRTAVSIKRGEIQNLKLGNLSIVRDWGWAPEYVEAMWLMLQQDEPEDFVIATGEGTTLQDFASSVFKYLDLDWKKYIVFDSSLIRPYELEFTVGNAAKAYDKLGWKAQIMMPQISEILVEKELGRRGLKSLKEKNGQNTF